MKACLEKLCREAPVLGGNAGSALAVIGRERIGVHDWKNVLNR